jgi:hypothetical protein
MRWSDWFELTKAKQSNCGLGNTTFSDSVRRLMEQGKVKQSQIAKNKFYQAIFTPGSSPGVVPSRSENGGSGHDPVAPAPDKATQALEHLLNRKSFDVV